MLQSRYERTPGMVGVGDFSVSRPIMSREKVDDGILRRLSLVVVVLAGVCLCYLTFYGDRIREEGSCGGYPYHRIVSDGFDIYGHAAADDPDVTALRNMLFKSDTPFSNYYHFYANRVCNGSNPCTALAIDVGAYVGTHALYMAKLGMQVHAFEPHRPSAALLKCAAGTNGMNNLHVVREGLGSEIAPACMLQPRSNLPAWSTIIPKQLSNCPPLNIINVTTLDDYWSTTLGAGQIDVLKIDAEGHEYHVLDGARQLLQNKPPKYILLEYHPKLLALRGIGAQELLGLIFAASYRVYDCQVKRELRHGKNALKALEVYRHSGLVTDLLLVRKSDFRGGELPAFRCAYNSQA